MHLLKCTILFISNEPKRTFLSIFLFMESKFAYLRIILEFFHAIKLFFLNKPQDVIAKFHDTRRSAT